MFECTQNCQSRSSGDNKRLLADGGDMPPEARRELVLDVVAEHDIPLPPLAIWGALNRQYRVTFSYRTLQNILDDLVESEDLFRVDTGELRKGEIKPIEGDPSSTKSYYFITESGLDRLEKSD